MRLKVHSNLLLLSSVSILIFSAIILLFSSIPLHKDKEKISSSSPSKPCEGANCTIGFFLNEQKILEQRLQTEEPAEVYGDVLSKYKNSSANNQHAVAHIFGEVLYKSKGLSGITVCDGSFAFGCFHGFMVNALAEEGLGSIQELDRMCNEKFGKYNLGCQHGLGHGIAEYYGSSKLNQALDTCATLSWKHQLMGCSGGVFMEYIMPTEGNNNPGSVRINPLKANAPYLPCTQVQSKYKLECFYNLGNYFYNALNGDTHKGLDLCGKILDSEYRKTCLMGLGNAIISNTRDVSTTIKSCQLANNPMAEINCRSGAAWILYSNVSSRSEARSLCEGINNQDQEQCLTESNLLEFALRT